MLKRYGPHSQKSINMLISNILGDGSFRKGYNIPNKKGSILTVSQGEKNKDYVMFLHELYANENLCYVDRKPNKVKIYKNKTLYKYTLTTISHITLDYLFDIFYQKDNNGKYVKGLYDKSYIYNNFNELSLAL